MTQTPVSRVWMQNWSTIKFGPVNPARSFRAIYASEHHKMPRKPCSRLPMWTLASTRWEHVEIRQEPNQSKIQDTELVAAWGPRHSCGHIQRPNWSGGQLGGGLSSHCRSGALQIDSAPPMSTWMAITEEVMGWGTQAFHEHKARDKGILPWSGTPSGSRMALHGTRSGWRGDFLPTCLLNFCKTVSGNSLQRQTYCCKLVQWEILAVLVWLSLCTHSL